MSTYNAFILTALLTLVFFCLWRVSCWLRANARPPAATKEEKQREWEDQQY